MTDAFHCLLCPDNSDDMMQASFEDLVKHFQEYHKMKTDGLDLSKFYDIYELRAKGQKGGSQIMGTVGKYAGAFFGKGLDTGVKASKWMIGAEKDKGKKEDQK